MVVATKRTVKKAQSKGFEFIIESKDVIERVNFGAFEVVRTKRGILYKNYTGYSVFTTPYAIGIDGKAHNTSMYSWLDNLIKTYHVFKGHEKEPFADGLEITKGQMFDSEKIITEVNMSYPMTAFIDIDRATKFANEHIQWMNEKQKELMGTMNKKAPEEDIKANAEFEEEQRNVVIIADMIPDK